MPLANEMRWGIGVPLAAGLWVATNKENGIAGVRVREQWILTVKIWASSSK